MESTHSRMRRVERPSEDRTGAGGKLAASSQVQKSVPRINLVPAEGVQIGADGEFTATALPFWLQLEPFDAVKRHRWVRIRYSASFFDEPVRPLIRFVASNGKHVTQAMNGTVLGSAEWLGRIPKGTTAILISPGRRLGPFSFRIDELENVSRGELLRDGFRGDTPALMWSITSRLVSSSETAWHALKIARGGMPLERYWEWRSRLSRPLDLGGLDKPRSDWARGPEFHLLLDLREGDAAKVGETIASLSAQAYRRWKLHVRVDDGTPASAIEDLRAAMAGDPRIVEWDAGTVASEIPAARGWVGIVQAGDLLAEHALAILTETVAGNPELEALYSDEDVCGASGLFRAPLLKPDWSPLLHESVRYLGRLLLLRLDALERAGSAVSELLEDEDGAVDRVVTAIRCGDVGHVRRVLYHRAETRPRSMARPALMRSAAAEEAEWPHVSIVIPTRDRADLLATCVNGLKHNTDYPSYDVVIVDNGTVQPEALRLLGDLQKDSRFSVLSRPGPFNYARLSNDGARASQSGILVFLNNDTDLFDSGWLKALVRWAVKPEVGVVGAKLLFPNGKIQHAGVILGMGGIAGHVYRRSLRHASGYMHQLEVAREVTAVTAACIAIDRAKFEAIGGFDEHNLPIDLNDIDLCLRVAERGWTNIWTPESVAIHMQSASRGLAIDPFGKYRRERTYFAERWAEAIRDDPYFHPGFSLFSLDPSLA